MSFTEIAVISVMLFSALPSQAGTAESVCGIVQDQTGAFVGGAPLELRTANTRLDATTDAGGQFCFRPLEPGEYELTVHARDFRTNQQKISVHAGESIHLTISLSLGAVAEQFTVAEGPADVDSLNVAQHVLEMFRRTLPQGPDRSLLDRLANRLTKIASEARKLEPK